MNESIVNGFAKRISGQEYPLNDRALDLDYAKANNLVICFGASDDLLELRGAIYEEIGAYEGTFVYVVNGKVITESDFEDKHFEAFEILNIPVPVTIVAAIWCESDKFPKDLKSSWLIKVEGFESAPFDVMEDGELYCRGAVFLLK
jgi:hypothetical protein